MSPLVLALDVGTGSGRAALVDPKGLVVAQAARGWTPRCPPELAPLGREYDAEALFDAVLEATREVLGGVDASRVAALAVTGQRIACAFLGASDETLYLGPNGDVRALLGADLRGLDADALYAKTGRFPPLLFAPARLAWMAAARPDARVTRVLGMPDYFAWRLGAREAITDATIACDLMMLDVATRARAPVGADNDPRLAPEDDARWPAIGSPGLTIGALDARLAETLGLSKGLPIALGAADTPLALLAAGAVDPGATVLVAGSSAPLCRVVDAPRRDPAGRLWLDPHVLADRWLLEANLGEMGTAHAWLVETLLGARDFAAADALARDAAVGCAGASAHVGPRAMDLRALNTARPAGLLFPFGQTSGATAPRRAELLRAFLESAAFATRAGLAWLDAARAADGPLLVVGGLSRSALFGEVLASALGREVVGARPDASVRGAAMCAAVAAGWADTIEAAATAMADAGAVYAPDEDAREAYDEAFERWLEREDQLEER